MELELAFQLRHLPYQYHVAKEAFAELTGNTSAPDTPLHDKPRLLYTRFYLNPAKVQCYRITYVHSYYSIPSTTILWKILYLIFLDILNQILEVPYLDLPQESTGIN